MARARRPKEMDILSTYENTVMLGENNSTSTETAS